jgi:predicted NBD/HSP70 family sugar kinase
MKVLCFDIGGTNIKYGIIEDGVILEKSMFATHYKRGHKDVTDRLIATAKKVQKKYPDIAGVGISCAGSINFDEGRMITPPDAIPQFGEWDFTKLFMDELGLPIVADNDVNSFAACECKMGAGKKYKTYIVMTVGTGIGGAIVVNNKLWRGKDYNAGEIGRMLVDGVHWEKMASITALIKSAKLRELDIEEGKDVFDLYDQGDRVAQLVVGEFYRNLGKGIANLVYIFNPEAIIIGGGVSAREGFGNEINAYADYYLVDGFQDTVDIIPAQFKNDGGILGAYCNFIDRYGKGEE